MRPIAVNFVLLGAAAVLSLAAWLVVDKERKNFTEVDKIPRLFEGFTPENVRILILTKPKTDDTAAADPKKKDEPKKDQDPEKKDQDVERLTLVKQDTTWKIYDGELAGVPVQAAKVESDILKHMKEIRVNQKTKRASADAAYLERTGLDEKHATSIVCADAERKPVAELLLGKDASGGKWGEDVTRGYFVRAKSSTDAIVYEVDYWMLSLKADDWADKKIHEFEQGKVKSFSVKNPKGEVTFTKDKTTDAEWKCAKPPEGMGAIRQGEVANMLARFWRMDAIRFLGPLAAQRDQRSLGLEPPDYELVTEVEEGNSTKTYRVRIGKKIADKGEFNARADNCEFLFSLGDYVVTPFDKDPKDLFDPAASSRPSSSSSSGPTSSKPAEPPKQNGGK